MDVTEIDFDTPAVVELTAENWRTELMAHTVTLVSFGAPWCGHCRRLDPVLQRLAVRYDGRAKIAKLNTDRARELSRSHRVRGLPQIVLFVAGQERGRLVAGFQSEATIAELIDRHLNVTAEAPQMQAGPDSTSNHEAYAIREETLGKLDAFANRWIGPSPRDRKILSAGVQVLRQEKYLPVFEEMAQIVSARRAVGDPEPSGEFGAGIAILERRLEGVGFDPLIISAIIAAVMALFDLCPFARTRDVRSLPRRRLARQIKRELPSADWEAAFAAADTAAKLAQEATEQELQALIYDCCS